MNETKHDQTKKWLSLGRAEQRMSRVGDDPGNGVWIKTETETAMETGMET